MRAALTLGTIPHYPAHVIGQAIFRQIELFLQSRAHFVRPHLPQVLGDRQLFNIIEQQRELSLLCDSFSRSPPEPAETQTLLWNPLDRLATSGSTIPEKA